jgi:lipopolysaccharide biosynthesis glycosyltransferase
MISGQSFVGIQPPEEIDYYFTRYPHIWGWATWREAWQRYRLDLRHLDEEYRSGEWHRIFADHPRMAKVWYRRWKWCQREEKNSTWDYQWMHACLQTGGLSVAPARNLVENIGFGPDATHTRIAAEFDAEAQQGLAFPLRHPERVERDPERDQIIGKRYFDYSEWTYQLRRIPRLLLPKLVKQGYHRWRERQASRKSSLLAGSAR